MTQRADMLLRGGHEEIAEGMCDRIGIIQGGRLIAASVDGSGDTLRLPMSRRDIANFLRLATETVCRVLTRFEQKGWIRSDWGTSENNRRARFYAITAAGKRRLAAEADNWARTVAIVNRLLATD